MADGMKFPNGCLQGLANHLRTMHPGDSFMVECEDRAKMQTRISGCIGSYKRGGGRGWQRYSIMQVAGGVQVMRRADAA